MPDIDYSFLDDDLLIELSQLELDDYIIELAWSSNGENLAAITVEGKVFLVNKYADITKYKLIGQHDKGGNSVSWRSDGKEFATVGHDGKIKIWDGISGNEIISLEAGDSWVSKAIYNPHSNWLASAAGRQLRLWDTNREVFYESFDHSSTIADLGWSPDGSGVAVAAYNGVTLHVPHKQKQPRKYSWKGSSLVLAWSPDSRYIATGEQDSTVHFWHRASGEDDRMYGFPTKVLELSWNSTGRWLATGGSSSVILWDCSGKGPAGRKPREYLAHSNKLTQVAFQPAGELLASTGKDAVLAIWDPMKHDKIIGRKILSAPASSLRWNKDANLAIGQEDGRVAIFKLKS